MSPIDWGWELAVWVYALAWFLLNERVKILAYKVLDKLQHRHVTTIIVAVTR